MEHFRVDSSVDENHCAQIARFESDMEKFRKQFIQNNDINTIAEIELIKAIVPYLEKAYDIKLNSSLDGLCNSLSYGLDKHERNLQTYKQNLDSYNAKSCELGYLIEVHSCFVGWLKLGQNEKPNFEGTFPMFEEFYQILKKASEKIDWIALACCKQMLLDVPDGAVIDCRNGRFEKSVKELGFKRSFIADAYQGKRVYHTKVTYQVDDKGTVQYIPHIAYTD